MYKRPEFLHFLQNFEKILEQEPWSGKWARWLPSKVTVTWYLATLFQPALCPAVWNCVQVINLPYRMEMRVTLTSGRLMSPWQWQHNSLRTNVEPVATEYNFTASANAVGHGYYVFQEELYVCHTIPWLAHFNNKNKFLSHKKFIGMIKRKEKKTTPLATDKPGRLWH